MGKSFRITLTRTTLNRKTTSRSCLTWIYTMSVRLFITWYISNLTVFRLRNVQVKIILKPFSHSTIVLNYLF